jgi:hypothetical protein
MASNYSSCVRVFLLVSVYIHIHCMICFLWVKSLEGNSSILCFFIVYAFVGLGVHQKILVLSFACTPYVYTYIC